MTGHGDGFTDSDREAVLTALAVETRLKHEGKPYSEGVITACEVCLRVYARKLDDKAPSYTLPHDAPPNPPIPTTLKVVPKELEPPKEYWWNKDN